MAVDPRSTGTHLKPFKEEVRKNEKSLRIGAQVPLGDVNLAYIHTPRVNPDSNLSIINTTDIYDNLIPTDQRESLVAADIEGQLSYVELINESEIQVRAPKNIFPSSDVTLTNRFKKGTISRDAALYYRFELKYHYDSKEREAGVRIPYDGTQIKITDSNGNLLDSSYGYEIYITPQANNKRISLVEIYLHNRATKDETFFVQYNHVEAVATNENIRNVKKKVQLYVKASNTVLEGGAVKTMLENGKSRILNAVSAHTLSSMNEVQAEQALINPRNIYAVTSQSNKDGYELTVPQKAEQDPRKKNAFSFRVNVTFYGPDGKKRTYTTGFMTNWVINKEAALSREEREYIGEFKDISGLIGLTKMDVEQMVKRAAPAGYETRFNMATYTIQDDKFNKLYSDIVPLDNTEVLTSISSGGLLKAKGKSLAAAEAKWARAEVLNAILKNNRIDHQCSVIAERQKTLWKFKWEAVAKGIILREKKRMVKETDADGNERLVERTIVIEEEWQSQAWRKLKGEAVVKYNPDGTYTSKFTPNKLPVKEIEELGVLNLEWLDVMILEGDTDCGVEIVGNTIRHKMTGFPSRVTIGEPYTLPVDSILKMEGAKSIGEIFGPNAIYDKLKIPRNVAYKDICLRLERGVSKKGQLEDISTMDFRINYRFKVTKGGYEGLPVDQYYKWFGQNRIRFKDFIDEKGELVKDLSIDVVAWTMFEDLELAPIYSLRIEEQKRIDIEGPRVADDKLEHDNWYMRIKDGRLFKTISLPGYDAERKVIPQIYVVYPELIPFAPSLCETKELELEYSVGEYLNQEFLGERTMLVEDEQPVILDETTIRVVNAPLRLDSSGERSFIQVQCIRGNKNKDLRIADVDAAKGIIYLLDRIHDQDIIRVNYVYDEYHYTYKGFERHEKSQSILNEKFDFKINLNANIELKIEYQETPPVITIEGPSEIIDGDSATYQVKVKHATEKVLYHLFKKWSENSSTIESDTTQTNEYTTTITVGPADYNRLISNKVRLTGNATADGMTANAEKEITIVTKKVAPTVEIEAVQNNNWCINLIPELVVPVTIQHEEGFTYMIKVDGVEKISGESELSIKEIAVPLLAVEYLNKTEALIEVSAVEVNGLTTTKTYKFDVAHCGDSYIAHPHQLKIVFEYGDVKEIATGEIYTEGQAGTIDSYLFLNNTTSKYINYQQRAFENANGKMYLDYDRITNQKILNGKEQKEILTVDNMKNSIFTYVLHDYNGFFKSNWGKYEVTERFNVKVFAVNEDEEVLLLETKFDGGIFPINKNSLTAADFTNSVEKGYYSICSINIPSDGVITDEHVKPINKQGIVFN